VVVSMMAPPMIIIIIIIMGGDVVAMTIIIVPMIGVPTIAIKAISRTAMAISIKIIFIITGMPVMMIVITHRAGI
jgi:hypothetical protein